MTTKQLLFIHGAWHGGWCWNRLAEILIERGYEVARVDLPSAGGGGGLEADAAVVRSALDELGREGRTTTVVGHSYGGIVITQATAGRTDIEQLIYVCAFQPEVGESLLDIMNESPPWIEIDAAAGQCTVSEPGPIFFGDVSEELVHQAVPRLVPQTLSSVAARVTATGWREHPSTYVVCTQDRVIPVEAQRAMAQRSLHVRELESSHSPFLSHPEELASLIETELSRVTAEGGI